MERVDQSHVKYFLDVKPGEKRTVCFGLTWHFPNAKNGQQVFFSIIAGLPTKGSKDGWWHEGNMYANWWSDALDVAGYLQKRLDELFKALVNELRLEQYTGTKCTCEAGFTAPHKKMHRHMHYHIHGFKRAIEEA